MKYTHLVPRKWGQFIHFDFRHKIPTDLVSYFGGKRQFQISLNNVSNKEILLVSQSLKILVQELFSDIRSGMEDLTLEDIKEILRIEVRKSILHSHHVDLGTSKYDSMKKIESVETISSRETKMRKSLLTDLKGVESTVDEKLQTILESLDIKFEKGSGLVETFTQHLHLKVVNRIFFLSLEFYIETEIQCPLSSKQPSIT